VAENDLDIHLLDRLIESYDISGFGKDPEGQPMHVSLPLRLRTVQGD